MKSKKVRAAIVAAVVATITGLLSAVFGEEVVTPDVIHMAELVVGTLIAYIIGQGVADAGKEAAKVE